MGRSILFLFLCWICRLRREAANERHECLELMIPVSLFLFVAEDAMELTRAKASIPLAKNKATVQGS